MQITTGCISIRVANNTNCWQRLEPLELQLLTGMCSYMMTMENKIGKTLHVIGVATIIVGIIGSLILSINLDSDFPITLLVGGIASFISGMVFVGFGEIISLLQKNIDKQDAILSYIKSKNTDEKVAPKTVLQDIEDNLPNM